MTEKEIIDGFLHQNKIDYQELINQLYDKFNEYNAKFKVTEDIKEMVSLEKQKNSIVKQIKLVEQIHSNIYALDIERQIESKNEKGN